MSDPCFKGHEEEYNKQGRCCCNCRFKIDIMRHPWNKAPELKGSISEVAGMGCAGLVDEDYPKVIFMESLHGRCEIHDWTEKK